MSEICVASVAEFHAKLRKLEGETDFLYRGQADAAWPVDCAAARRLKNNPAAPIEEQLMSQLLVGYLEFLIDRARMRGFLPPDGFDQNSTDLELMAQLQHQGAATGLIDFTRQPLVALWFACNEHREKNGAVYLLPRSAIEEMKRREDTKKKIESLYKENKLRAWEVAALGNRIVAQSSVLVFGLPMIASSKMERLIVKAENKSAVIKELDALYGVNEETLFSDFSGYAVANSSSKAFDVGQTISYWEEQIESASGETEKAKAHFQCGVAYSAIREHEEAIEHYDAAIAGYKAIKVGYNEVIALDPQLALAYNNRGTAKAALGKYEEAIADYDKAIALNDKAIDFNPQYAEAYSNRGVAKAALRRYEEAISDYDKAIALNPQYAEAYSNRGVAKADLGQHQEAMADFGKAIDLKPQYAILYNNRGFGNQALGHHQEAIADYDKAIRLNPQYALAYCNRGNAHLCLGAWREAEKDLTKARDVGGDVVAEFQKDYGSVEKFEKQFSVTLPDYIKALLNPPPEG